MFAVPLAADNAKSIVITSASYNPTTQILAIEGNNFTLGTSVWIERTPLAVMNATPSWMQASLPTPPPGTYLLTVSKGSAAGDTASFVIAIGNAGPAGPTGPMGPTGATGPTGTTGAAGPAGGEGDQGTTGAPRAAAADGGAPPAGSPSRTGP